MQIPYIRHTVKPFWLHRLFGAKPTIREFVIWETGGWRELPAMDWVAPELQLKLTEAYLKMIGGK